MPRLLLTPDRLRSVIAGARTEADISRILRRHRIRYTWTTAPGFLAAMVPARSGSVIIYRTASRSAPFTVRSSVPDRCPFPVPRVPRDD